jgi:hypothetical protein
VDKVVVPPIYMLVLATHEKKDIKAKWEILDLVKDHLIPHLSKKNMTKYVFDALLGLFQIPNMNRKMVLRNKVISI